MSRVTWSGCDLRGPQLALRLRQLDAAFHSLPQVSRAPSVKAAAGFGIRRRSHQALELGEGAISAGPFLHHTACQPAACLLAGQQLFTLDTAAALHPGSCRMSQSHVADVRDANTDKHMPKVRRCVWQGWKDKQTFRGHKAAVTALAFCPTTEDTFASASADGTLKVHMSARWRSALSAAHEVLR